MDGGGGGVTCIMEVRHFPNKGEKFKSKNEKSCFQYDLIKMLPYTTFSESV